MEAILEVRKEEQEERTQDTARYRRVTGGVIGPNPPSQDITELSMLKFILVQMERPCG